MPAPAPPQTAAKIRVYYNSACPVCKAGIAAQQNKPALCGISWEDVHADQALVQQLGADLEFVRERLHVVDEHGSLQIGFDAFLTIWRNSASEQWKCRFFSLPGIRHGGRLAYNLFAALLYRWNRWLQHW